MKTQTFIKTVILTIFILASFTACATTQTRTADITPQPEQLDGYWRVTEIAGKTINSAINHQQEPNLMFVAENGRVSGFNGCNRLAGGTREDLHGFHFTAVAATRMACIPPLGTVENDFMNALNTTTARRMNGKTLELLDSKGFVLMKLEKGGL